MTVWNLRSRSNVCHRCAIGFADGERCRSAVVSFDAPIAQELLAEKIAAQEKAVKLTKSPDYVRFDFCKACWRQLGPVEWISVWLGEYTAPEPPAPEPLPRETAESLLYKLIEDENSVEHTRVIFILAVMLERKKVLIERRVEHGRDGSVVRVYEHKKSGAVMLVVDPNLQESEIVGVQQEVDALLAEPAPRGGE